jgi:hypothetical protein
LAKEHRELVKAHDPKFGDIHLGIFKMMDLQRRIDWNKEQPRSFSQKPSKKCLLSTSIDKKARYSCVSHSCQRDKQSMKSNCAFVIKTSGEHHKKHQEANHRKAV